jgi:hypothetical protein
MSSVTGTLTSCVSGLIRDRPERSVPLPRGAPPRADAPPTSIPPTASATPTEPQDANVRRTHIDAEEDPHLPAVLVRVLRDGHQYSSRKCWTYREPASYGKPADEDPKPPFGMVAERSRNQSDKSIRRPSFPLAVASTRTYAVWPPTTPDNWG